MYPTFARWVQSHRDLPIKVNQWCNIVVSDGRGGGRGEGGEGEGGRGGRGEGGRGGRGEGGEGEGGGGGGRGGRGEGGRGGRGEGGEGEGGGGGGEGEGGSSYLHVLRLQAVCSAPDCLSAWCSYLQLIREVLSHTFCSDGSSSILNRSCVPESFCGRKDTRHTPSKLTLRRK